MVKSLVDTPQISPIPSRKLWMAAIKLPMYSVAIVPIATGTAVAYRDTGAINWAVFATFLAAAIVILVWENLCNDVFDAETGIDIHKAHSVVNLTGKKNLILAIANICLLMGIGGVLAISWLQQDAVVVSLVALCCLLGYMYQGPPFRLGYQGWGEILCFFAFGPLGVSAAYYSQTQSWSIGSLAAAVVVGIITSLILFCSHFNQVEDDLAAGKRSPVVRLGTKRASQLLPWVCAVIYAVTIVAIALQFFPIWTAIVLVSLPIAWKLCTFIGDHHEQSEMLLNCRFIAVALHFVVGSCLSVSLIF
ncbi:MULTISPECIES: 2-carboxy-1,4-naphthoquinone phytyltransferase [Pseudanabaena]|uniref:2-carboxy-1,4-naphthoquinone phytyltransferase n=2 Tax=Pseudanabaena TaxID=1152 RepID=L8MYY0_9CYAN|nr:MULTISPECIES: 2-carboxy-1,4-naphthoquinone phytyltransferase [Pseudanabaena]ELS31670.1 1,4-dihydroxy-2-naphthoate phytyltransferase [Pseudanabaena biceps PCC 7429]MDG3496081.1 2-carboxy-1,4-naphthoquinone phytyltransferase [Pseudanabaena catenata USMAC16]